MVPNRSSVPAATIALSCLVFCGCNPTGRGACDGNDDAAHLPALLHVIVHPDVARDVTIEIVQGSQGIGCRSRGCKRHDDADACLRYEIDVTGDCEIFAVYPGDQRERHGSFVSLVGEVDDSTCHYSVTPSIIEIGYE